MAKRKASAMIDEMITVLKRVPCPPSPPRRYIKFQKAADPNTHPSILKQLEHGGHAECDDRIDAEELAPFAKLLAVKVALALVFFAMAGVDDVASLFEMLDAPSVYFNLSGLLFHDGAEDEWRLDNVFSDSLWDFYFKGFAERIDVSMDAILPRAITMRYLFQSTYFFGLVLKEYKSLHGQLQRYILKVQTLVPEATQEEVQLYVLQDAWFTPDFHFVMVVDQELTLENLLDSI